MLRRLEIFELYQQARLANISVQRIKRLHLIKLSLTKKCVGNRGNAKIGKGARQRRMAKSAKAFGHEQLWAYSLCYFQEIETAFERAQPDKLISNPVSLAKA